MKIDVLVAEIGSTTTIVNAFNFYNQDPVFLGRGVSNTTVNSDVVKGLQLAIEDLSYNLKTDKIEYNEMFASSSAAGGLRMTVHGLVYEMTVRASKEAALNAGANIHLITAKKITINDLEKIKAINPNIILVAGGTDYGEKETALYNIKKVLELDLKIPIIYAGNIENQDEILDFFKKKNKEDYLKIVENVYPRVDFLNILPLRKVIYETFEENIIHAKGMNNIFDMVNQKIMPTPGSVMEATMILHEELGNIITIDVGGATTDIHSVSIPCEDFKEYQDGEPLSKRTVEGDLGVFINHGNVVSLFHKNEIRNKLNLTTEEYVNLSKNYSYIPTSEIQKQFVLELTKKCAQTALDRHVGDLKRVYTSAGLRIIPEGKDLSQVEYILLTGGALINLENTEDIILEYIKKNPTKLLPKKNVAILKDYDYILASVGVLSLKYPEIAIKLLKKSLRIE
ncbi:MAG: glutamate mutase L [Candidatus Izimaplasma sp.]|nr:glutamate mutase L [Candidatus Izimaplasma bacterium]